MTMNPDQLLLSCKNRTNLPRIYAMYQTASGDQRDILKHIEDELTAEDGSVTGYLKTFCHLQGINWEGKRMAAYLELMFLGKLENLIALEWDEVMTEIDPPHYLTSEQSN